MHLWTKREKERERERNYCSTLLYENVNAMIQYWCEKSILQFRAMIFLSIHNDQRIFIQFNYVFIIHEWKSIFISSKKNNFLELLTIITILIIDNLYETLSLTEILQIFSLVSRRKFLPITRDSRDISKEKERKTLN